MLPPTIPTSFVPRPSGAAPRSFHFDFTGAFGVVSYVILGIVFVLALGVFTYGRILSGSLSAKDAALVKAESTIDPVTVENFVRLRDRLDSGSTLLTNHIAFSNFFTLVENLMPSTARFTTLHLAANDEGGVKLEASGVARSFNALAAASAALAVDGRIKDAIFSNIVVSARDGSVSFALTAMLDPKLVAFSPAAPVAPAAPIESAAPVVPEENATTTPSL
ncbi:MAG: hypothetical protein G01um101449_32 [Parcubacteria group bacterium Gr01-1014_49]|nr:MAG: hypothetical protein G01um101449_32 [Parcubacteria group bacterium Gr01-1014_49]